MSDPGPRIGFLQECVRWWDHWLKDADNDVMEDPLLRAWIEDPIGPAPRHLERPGRWVSEPRWPSPQITQRRWYPAVDAGLVEAAPSSGRRRWLGDPLAGSEAGAWCPYGRPTDFPPDQRGEDGRSLTFTTAPIAESFELLGRPELTLELSVDRPLGLVAARLCDVFPDGRSLLVSRGLLNLTHRDGHDRVVPMEPGRSVIVRFPLDFAGFRFPEGHALRLSLSPTYWPFAWPSPEPVQLDLRIGEGTFLELPRRDGDDGPPIVFGPPEAAPSAAGTSDVETQRIVRRELGSGELRDSVITDERSYLEPTDLWFGERQENAHVLVGDDPLSARLEYHAEHHLRRDGWRIRVVVDTSVSADAENFVVATALDAYENQVRVHALRRSVQIPRDGN